MIFITYDTNIFDLRWHSQKYPGPTFVHLMFVSIHNNVMFEMIFCAALVIRRKVSLFYCKNKSIYLLKYSYINYLQDLNIFFIIFSMFNWS